MLNVLGKDIPSRGCVRWVRHAAVSRANLYVFQLSLLQLLRSQPPRPMHVMQDLDVPPSTTVKCGSGAVNGCCHRCGDNVRIQRLNVPSEAQRERFNRTYV
ncbi:hypothetical protein EVAR_88155_1 [Eumeta japonica]|uniref:Uncharacterized protein n=1 Tax=Eumeta variegata TaxID=151549 RepID=A0A4C1WEU9_EUMVA|nr:hypothetical protein EVAR_88155_1 [Eumeta japonica]